MDACKHTHKRLSTESFWRLVSPQQAVMECERFDRTFRCCHTGCIHSMEGHVAPVDISVSNYLLRVALVKLADERHKAHRGYWQRIGDAIGPPMLYIHSLAFPPKHTTPRDTTDTRHHEGGESDKALRRLYSTVLRLRDSELGGPLNPLQQGIDNNEDITVCVIGVNPIRPSKLLR
eukprot:GHVQ01030280.1.p1 GENE.GHVQ01030280.1~~GHVQ01030280.1.p1  ORF type:complete len:176 (+),score=24.69 GHVQ01030280.1:141-668(+)